MSVFLRVDEIVQTLVVVLAPVAFLVFGVMLGLLIGSWTPLWWPALLSITLPGLALAATAFVCCLFARKVPLRLGITPVLLRAPIYTFVVFSTAWWIALVHL